MRRRRWLAIGAALSLFAAALGAAADPVCDESAVREALGRLGDALGTPRARAAMQAARDDYDADQRFDDEENVKYLAAAALYVKAKDSLEAGDVDAACRLFQNAGKLIEAVIAGK
jgi:hypothetical protein